MISCAQLGTAVSCPYAAKQAGQGTVRQAACLGGLFEKPFKCRRPAELICSEIKGDASDRATYATRESGYIIFFFFFFSTDGTHSLSRSAFGGCAISSHPAPLRATRRRPTPLPPPREPFTHLRPLPGASVLA